jgi:release factor glutamine methyltransferase
VTPFEVIRSLDRAGVRVVRLDASPHSDVPEADLLVRREQAALAARTLEEADWRFEVGRHGIWRFTRHASYGWDTGLVVHLHWGLPAAPLPSAVLRPLERQIWNRAEVLENGLLSIDPASQLVVAAVQVVRPSGRRARWKQIVAEGTPHTQNGLARAADLARAAGVPGALRRGLAATDLASAPPGRDSMRDRAWLISSRIYGRSRSRRFRALLSGSPLLGQSVRRCRFSGVEVLAGPGVFRPMAVSENIVAAVLASVPVGSTDVVLEAGTGCGAVALAIARARPEARVLAADVSAPAIRWARRNQRALGTGVSFYRGSLLEPIPSTLHGRAAVVAGNVPYIPAEHAQPATADTPGAILGEGDDGLGLLRDLSADAYRYLRPGGHLILQLLASQWETFAGELHTLGYQPDRIVGRSGPHVVVTAARQ